MKIRYNILLLFYINIEGDLYYKLKKGEGTWMMILNKAIDSEHNFINEMLILGYKNQNQGYAYPRGDIEDIENELKAYNLKINDCFYIIKNKTEQIGIIGFIESTERIHIIGPVFDINNHTSGNVLLCLKLLLDMITCKGKTIISNILKENKFLSSALLENNFKITSSHIGMSIQLNDYIYKNNTTFGNIEEVKLEDVSYLSDIDILFGDTLNDWAEENIDSLYEYISEEYEIAAIICEGKVKGAIIWVWFDSLGYGRIEYIAIDKGEQRKGYASKLIDYMLSNIIEKLDNDLPNCLHLDLNEENKEAYELYIHKGFKVDFLDSVYRYY